MASEAAASSARTSLESSGASSPTVPGPELMEQLAELNKVFDRIGDWQNSRHRDFMLDDALDALQSMRKAELLEKAASLGVPASADADEDAVRAALEEHFRGVALEMARVAAGDEPELWDNQYMIALVGGLPSWWQDQHADEVRYREAEAQHHRSLLQSALQRANYLSHDERQAALAALAGLDEDGQQELLRVLRMLCEQRAAAAAVKEEMAAAEAERRAREEAGTCDAHEAGGAAGEAALALQAVADIQRAVLGCLSQLEQGGAAADVTAAFHALLDRELVGEEEAAVAASAEGLLQRLSRVGDGPLLGQIVDPRSLRAIQVLDAVLFARLRFRLFMMRRSAEILIPAAGELDAELEPDAAGFAARVKRVEADSPGSRTGPLARADIPTGAVIVAINGVGITSMPHAEALELLQCTNADPVRLLTLRPESAHAHMLATNLPQARCGALHLRVQVAVPQSAAAEQDVPVPWVVVRLLAAADLPRLPMGGREGDPFELTLSAGDGRHIIAFSLPRGCESGERVQYDGDALQGETSLLAPDVAELHLQLVEAHDPNGVKLTCDPLPLPTEAGGDVVAEDAVNADGAPMTLLAYDRVVALRPVHVGDTPRISLPASATGEAVAGSADGEGDMDGTDGTDGTDDLLSDEALEARLDGMPPERLYSPAHLTPDTHLHAMVQIIERRIAELQSDVYSKQVEELQAQAAERRQQAAAVQAELDEMERKVDSSRDTELAALEQARAALREAEAAREEAESALAAQQQRTSAERAELTALQAQLRKLRQEAEDVQRQLERVKASSTAAAQAVAEQEEDMFSISASSFIRFFAAKTWGNGVGQ